MLKILFLLISTLVFGSSELQHIKLQLKWKHQFQFAGYYMAKEKGFYKKANLDVDIVEYKNDINTLQSVESAKNGGVYGVGYPNIILDKANGANIMLLNAMNQLSPHVFLSLKSSDIKSIKDFKGKRLMVSKDVIYTASFIAMIRAANLTLDDVTLQEPTFDIQTLVDKKTDVITAYISNEPYVLQQQGVKYDLWNPAEYGFDFYDDILFTSTQEIKLHPKRVEAFRNASLKGWEYAYTHIDETVDIILKNYNTQHKTRDALLYEATELKKLAYYGGIELGTIELEKIKYVRRYKQWNLIILI